jgi:predicted dehydrogenase/threonine dehydrogenase-like Zn-dependent dehydrogenase
MLQVFDNLVTGTIAATEVPVPATRSGQILIATRRSLISAGSERTLVEFGEANLIAKARSQPEKVRQVLDKLKTDGLIPTVETVFSRLGQPMPFGYCNAGLVLDVGEGVTRFSVGDRVVSNGPHAEVVSVPQNLCARIPDDVGDDEAAFTVLAAVALQGVRLAEPTLGENVAVLGLGLLGLMTVQILRANGCRVLGIDFDSNRLELARQFSAETVELGAGMDPVASAMAFSDGRGIDAVLITAATKSDEPIHQAAQMCRKRGRIVQVGWTGLNLRRDNFYKKEISFQVSCSYGPGRYEPEYEQKGHDYPYGYVRWTEQRNFQAVLNLMADGNLNVEPLITHRFPIQDASSAYALLSKKTSALGILFTYPDRSPGDSLERSIQITPVNSSVPPLPGSQAVIGIIGAGAFASAAFFPNLSKTSATIKTIASLGGASAAQAARKFAVQQATTDYQTILDDPEINTVFIATRHNTHAQIVCEAIQAGKHVFVEKPLALNHEELEKIKETFNNQRSNFPVHLMVGFNRRFSPLSVKMRQLLMRRTQPLALIYTVNAGYIPEEHWVQDLEVGGGRIIGEGCHFIDLLRYFVSAPIVDVQARMMGRASGIQIRQDKMSIILAFEDGSLGTVHYFANGTKSFPKERVEVFSEGRILALDNFKTLRGYNWPGFKKKTLSRQDKGHTAEITTFVQQIVNGGKLLIPWEELQEVTLATFLAVEQANN